MSRVSDDKMPAGTTAGTPQVLLAHHLKQLKLPTVLREYEKLARIIHPVEFGALSFKHLASSEHT